MSRRIVFEHVDTLLKELNEWQCISFYLPRVVKVEKKLYDSVGEEDKDLKRQREMNEEFIRKHGSQRPDIGLPRCKTPTDVPFANTPVSSKDYFKKSYLIHEDEEFYTFSFEADLYVDKIVSDIITDENQRIITVAGQSYSEGVSTTHYLYHRYITDGKFVFDNEGKFLHCKFDQLETTEIFCRPYCD